MTKVQQYSFVCPPSVVQYAAFTCPSIDSSGNIDAYRRKRDLMVSNRNPKFELALPDDAESDRDPWPIADHDDNWHSSDEGHVLMFPKPVSGPKRGHSG